MQPTSFEQLAERYQLAAAYGFGSRALEVADRLAGRLPRVVAPGSDVDIAVRPAPGIRLTAKDRAALTIALEDLFAAPRVDLVILPEAEPFLALEVIRGELLWCADEDAEAEYELYVLRRAGDLAPFERERRAAALSERR